MLAAVADEKRNSAAECKHAERGRQGTNLSEQKTGVFVEKPICLASFCWASSYVCLFLFFVLKRLVQTVAGSLVMGWLAIA